MVLSGLITEHEERAKEQILNGWENFFVSELEASATLTGLVFVGVSVNLKKITAFAPLPNRALQALVALKSCLLE